MSETLNPQYRLEVLHDGHIEALNMRAVDLKVWAPWDWKAEASAMKNRGPAYALIRKSLSGCETITGRDFWGNMEGSPLLPGEQIVDYPKDDIVCLAGVVATGHGRGEAWCMTGEIVKECPVMFHKTVKDMLGKIEMVACMHRIECLVHPVHEKSKKWMDKLGFVFEGVATCYSPDGQDYFRYGRTRR